MNVNSKSETHESITAFVALGSNIGDSRRTLLLAMDQLRAFSTTPPTASSLYETEPVNCPADSPNFLNAVVSLTPKPGESPQSLLAKLQSLEKEFGRQPKKVLNEPRPLDLDLIAFGNETCSTTALTLPHPRAHLRKFVLAPLAEIAPDLILPGQREPVSVLLRNLTSDEVVRKLDGSGFSHV